jgi:TRAP-type C4-dicarboxylate transport system substrate-binding protein
MNRMLKNVGLALLLSPAIILVSLALFPCRQLAALTEDQISSVIKESMQSLLEDKDPTSEQSQGIDTLRKMLEKGDLNEKDIRQIVEQQLSLELEKHKLSRHKIGNILKRAPEFLPSVNSKDLHKMLWEKVGRILDKPLIVKIGTIAPVGTPWINFPRDVIISDTKEISGGKIIMKMYVGGVMGEEVDILRKMDMAQLNGCGCSSQGILKAAPEMSILFLPRLFRNYDEVDHILKKFRKDIDAAFEKRGYILDALVDSGFYYLWTKNKVSNLEDIRKQKLMTWFGNVETTTYGELGIYPTSISVPDGLTALSTGLVDAHCSPPAYVLGAQTYTIDRYYVTQPLFYSPGAIIYSKKMEEQFRNKYSDTLIHNFTEMRAYETLSREREWIEDHLRPYEKRCIQALEKYGIKPVRLDDKDMATIDTAAKRVWETLADKLYSRALLVKILNELEDFRNK